MSYDEFDSMLSKLRVPRAPGEGILAYADGGPVLSDDDFLSDADFKDEGSNSNGAVLSDSDFLSDNDFQPEPEGVAATVARKSAHAVLPTAGGLAGAATAAELSAPIAPFFGPAAPAVPVVAGLAGYFGGAYLTGKAQEGALDATGLNDTAQRQANEEAHPIASFVGDVAPAALTMSPGSLSDALASRVLSLGIMATTEGVQEKLSGEDLDPGKIAIAGGMGAVLNRPNAVGEAIMGPTAKLAARLKANGASAWTKYAPGRPDMEQTPTSDAEKADAAQSEPVKANTRGNAIEQPAPNEDVTIGANPDNKVTRDGGNSGKYAKTQTTAGPTPQSQLPADVEAALAFDDLLGPHENVNANGAPAPSGGAGVEEQAPAVQQPEQVLPAQPPVQPVAEPPVPRRVDEPTGIREMFEGKQPSQTLTDADFAEPAETAPLDETIKKQNAAAEQVDTAPTEARKEAGNYKKGHVTVDGLDVTIENPQGSERSGVGPDGKPWSVNMPDHYGYIKRTEGADGDHVDVYLGDTGDQHFIVDQFDPETGKFDEHKIMMNYAGENTARNAYNKAFSNGSGKDRLGAITPVSTDELKDWLKNGDTSKPFNPDAKSAKVSQSTAVVSQALERLESMEGGKAVADKIREADPADQAQLATRALYALDRRSDRALPQDGYAAARVPSKKPLVEGRDVTARSKADAARKTAALKAYRDAFDQYAPETNQVPTSKDDIAALKARVTAAVTDVDKAVAGQGYRVPDEPAYAWYRKAKALANAKRPSQAQIAQFIADEQLLRDKQGAAHVTNENKIEGGISRSTSAGDAALSSAENDAARKAPFEVGPEDVEADTEPTPVKGAEDLPREGDRELDITKPEDQAALAAALAEPSTASSKGWEAVKQSQAAAAEAEAAKTARLKALRLAQKGETKRDLVSSISDTDLQEPDKAAELREASKDAQRTLLQQFAENEGGAVNVGNLTKAVKQSLKMPKRDPNQPGIDSLLSSDISAHEAPRAGEAKTFISRDDVPASEEYNRSLDDRLNQNVKMREDHIVGLRKLADTAVEREPALADKVAFEDMYRAKERDQIASLPKDWQDAWEHEVQPVLDQNEMMRERAKQLKIDVGRDVDTGYLMRLAKNNEYDPLGVNNTDPIGAMRAMATGRPSNLYDRVFNALEDPKTGQRAVISLDPDGYTVWNKYKAVKVNQPIDWQPGQMLDVPARGGGTRQVKMTEAYVDEIEKNARGPDGKPMQYYKNPLLSAYVANAKLAALLRETELLESIKKENLFHQFAQPPKTPKDQIPDNYRPTTLANFKDWTMHPDIADVLDDYAHPGFEGDALNNLRNVNNALLRSLFVTPTAHIFNVAAHWFSGRGWDNFTPGGMGRLARTVPQAIKSVLTQDRTQSVIRQAGGGTVYGGVLSSNMINTLAKTFGEHMEADPERWGKMIKALGFNKPADYVAALYKGSSHVMWAVNDMLVTQRFLENQMKGMSVQGALNETMKDIPNYRIPTKVMGSRFVGKFMKDNLFASFNRYHYGMMNAWANLVKDGLATDSTPQQRIDAAGKLAAIGFAMFVVKPVLDHIIQNVTGNPDAEMHARGPLTIPEGVKQARKTGDFSSIASSLVPLSPVVQTAEEIRSNKDFAGRPIAKPGDVANALHGSPTGAGRIALDEATHLAKGVIAPVNTALNAMGRAQNEGRGAMSGLGAAARDQLFDIKNPSNAARNWQRNAPVKAQRLLRTDMKKPRDPIERLYDHFLGTGQSHF